VASLTRITEGTGTVISLHELKSQVNYFEPDADALLAGYIRAGQNWVAEALGRPLLDETWEYRIDHFPCGFYPLIQIPMPVKSITTITYLDSEGAQQILDTGNYLVVGDLIHLTYGHHWPSTRHEAGTVRITFVSGYGVDHNSIPEPIREAVMLLAGRFFAQRVSILEQGWFESSLLDQLLRPYRWRLVEAV
jgi:uncharacterized phiE125 gp8 family phage protein